MADFSIVRQGRRDLATSAQQETAVLAALDRADLIQQTEVFDYEVVSVDANGTISRRETRQNRYFSEDLGNGVSLAMVHIPGGTFTMGSTEDESELPRHKVAVPEFFMGRYPVAQAQWRAVAAMPPVEGELLPNPSGLEGEDFPVEMISWYEAVEFCARLSAHTGREYRLPSEAEWEYACRAGTQTAFHFGETITTEAANVWEADLRRNLTPVGYFGIANAFGLSDMHGNVREWCQDVWHDNYEGAPRDGTAWLEGGDQNRRILRGGSWYDYPQYCRSAYRDRYAPDYYYDYDYDSNVGFRVCCSAPRAQLPPTG